MPARLEIELIESEGPADRVAAGRIVAVFAERLFQLGALCQWVASPSTPRVQRKMDDLGPAVHPQRELGRQSATDVENRRRHVKQP